MNNHDQNQRAIFPCRMCVYTEAGDRVRVKELFDFALYPSDSFRQPSLKESREVGEIMDRIPGWERLPKVTKTKDYGAQRCWQCLSVENDAAAAQPFY